jgi:choline transport protein
MSYVVGMAVNIVTVAWLVFAIVFFSFPYVKPISGMLLSRTLPLGLVS